MKNNNKLSAVLLTVIFIICRIPYLIAYYPGLMIYDTASSILQFYGYPTFAASLSNVPGAILTNHHGVLYTLLMGGAVRLGELLGSQNTGFFIYILLQTVLGSAKMVLDTGRHPGDLKDMVCSPAGTTIEAVRVLEEKGFRSAVMEGTGACIKKSAQMNASKD